MHASRLAMEAIIYEMAIAIKLQAIAIRSIRVEAIANRTRTKVYFYQDRCSGLPDFLIGRHWKIRYPNRICPDCLAKLLPVARDEVPEGGRAL